MVITDCLGRERETVHVWPDGSYECPFCGYGVEIGTAACRNPACFATPGFSPERAREQLAQQEAREAEEHSKVAVAAFRESYARERRETEAKKRTELAAECATRGACARCLFAAGWEYRAPRFIKHRKVCPRTSRTP